MPNNKRIRRARAGDRSFQSGTNGKGDASRISDIEAFRANYDLIRWSRREPAQRPEGKEYSP